MEHLTMVYIAFGRVTVPFLFWAICLPRHWLELYVFFFIYSSFWFLQRFLFYRFILLIIGFLLFFPVIQTNFRAQFYRMHIEMHLFHWMCSLFCWKCMRIFDNIIFLFDRIRINCLFRPNSFKLFGHFQLLSFDIMVLLFMKRFLCGNFTFSAQHNQFNHFNYTTDWSRK